MARYISSIRDSIGKTVLGDVFYAIENINDERAISFINSSGFDVNQINPKTGKTLLQTSLEQLSFEYLYQKNNPNFSNYNIIRELLKNNVSIDREEIEEINNKQLIILFFINDQYDIFEYFLKIGADPNVKYKGKPINTGNKYYEYILENDTPLFLYATERLYRLSKNYNRNRDINNIDIVKEEEQKISEIMDMLLEKGVDPYISDKYSRVSLEIVMNMDPFPYKDDYKKYWIKELINYTKNATQLVRYFVYLLKNFKRFIDYKDIFTFFLNKGGIQIIQECYNQDILILKGLMDSFDGYLKDNVATLEVMEFLIANGASVDEIDKNGRSLLQYLLINKNYKKARWLVQHGANPNIQSDSLDKNVLLIEYFIIEQDEKSIMFLLDLVDWNQMVDKDIFNALPPLKKLDSIILAKNIWHASAFPNENIVTYFITAGAKLDYVYENFTVLSNAAYYGNTLVLKVLLENGFDINTKNSVGDTALHIAARNTNGNQNADVILQILIQEGADINSRNKEGDTPLHWAANPHNKKSFNPENYKMNEQLASLLIEYEADPTIKNKKNKTALFYAKTDSMTAIINAGLDTIKKRQTYNFDLSEIEIDNTRLLYDSIMGDETPIKDYLQFDPNNKVLIIGNFILGINAEAFLEQYKDSQNRYEHKFYECKNVLSRWPKKSDIEWTTGTMFNLIKIGPYGGFIDFDIFFGILNSKDRLFELRKIKEIPAIAGLQMLHHEPQASSSEHCQGGAINDYYEVRKVQYNKRLSSPTKSPTPTEKTASPTSPTSQQSKRGRRGGKKTRRRRHKV
jgi:ankyrin repeat protein